MDFIFIKSTRPGMEDTGSIYARLRTASVNVKAVTGFTVHHAEWDRYRTLRYNSSAIIPSIGICYGQFARILARIKAAFESDDFDPSEARSVIDRIKREELDSVQSGPECRMRQKLLFEDYLSRYIDELSSGSRTKKGRMVNVSPAYIKGLRILLNKIRMYQEETHSVISIDDMTMETRNRLIRSWKASGLMPNAINSYMTDIHTVARAAYEDKFTSCDGFRHSDFVPRKEEVDNIYLNPGQIQEMMDLDLGSKEAVITRLEGLDIDEKEKLVNISKCRITHVRAMEHVRDVFIVGCLTGQRVSDYSRIGRGMVTEINGVEFIQIIQQKTGKKVYIPLDKRVGLIVDKYGGCLPHVSANGMNRLIKTVGLVLGWTWDCGLDPKRLNPRRGRRFCDMLLSHTARRSFATNAYKAGVPVSSIQAITGHSSEAQLRRYLKLGAEERAIIALRDFKGVIDI